MDGLVSAPFGGAIQRFRLTIGGAQELEEKCDAGLPVIARRLAMSEWRLPDVRETLRLGLIGGGMDSLKAQIMIDRYAEHGLDHLRSAALAVLSPVLFGVPDDPPGKSAPGPDQSPAGPGGTGEPLSVPSTG